MVIILQISLRNLPNFADGAGRIRYLAANTFSPVGSLVPPRKSRYTPALRPTAGKNNREKGFPMHLRKPRNSPHRCKPERIKSNSMAPPSLSRILLTVPSRRARRNIIPAVLFASWNTIYALLDWITKLVCGGGGTRRE